MIGINIHRIKSVNACERDDTSWLTIATEDGQSATLFVSADMAKALERTFNEVNAMPQDAETAMWARAGK